MGILDSLSQLSGEQLAQLLGRVDELTAQGLLPQLEREIDQRCSQNGRLWLRFVSTLDEADRDNPIKPFPIHKPYVDPIWATLERSKRVVWAKSRQMVASWELCAFACWSARYHPYTAVYWQSQKDDDANSMVGLPGQAPGRCQFIEANLPRFLRQSVRTNEGRLVYPNGSFIQALAGGANQVRSHVYSIYIGDEFAFQEEASGVWTAISPLLQKGSQIIVVSTPNGGPPHNTFANLYHGVSRSDPR